MKFSILFALFLVLFSLPALGNENPINYEIDQLSEITDYLDIAQDGVSLDSYTDFDVEYASGDSPNSINSYITMENYPSYLASYAAIGNPVFKAYTVLISPAKDCDCRSFTPS